MTRLELRHHIYCVILYSLQHTSTAAFAIFFLSSLPKFLCWSCIWKVASSELLLYRLACKRCFITFSSLPNLLCADLKRMQTWSDEANSALLVNLSFYHVSLVGFVYANGEWWGCHQTDIKYKVCTFTNFCCRGVVWLNWASHATCFQQLKPKMTWTVGQCCIVRAN